MENNRVMKQKYKKNIATAALIFFVGIVCITIFQNNKKGKQHNSFLLWILTWKSQRMGKTAR